MYINEKPPAQRTTAVNETDEEYGMMFTVQENNVDWMGDSIPPQRAVASGYHMSSRRVSSNYYIG